MPHDQLPDNDSIEAVKGDFKKLLLGQFDDVDENAKKALDDAARYAAERAAHLSLLVGQPGFEEAVVAERDNVSMHAGLLAVAQADALDQKVLGTLQGGLFFAARLLMVAAL